MIILYFQFAMNFFWLEKRTRYFSLVILFLYKYHFVLSLFQFRFFSFLSHVFYRVLSYLFVPPLFLSSFYFFPLISFPLYFLRMCSLFSLIFPSTCFVLSCSLLSVIILPLSLPSSSLSTSLHLLYLPFPSPPHPCRVPFLFPSLIEVSNHPYQRTTLSSFPFLHPLSFSLSHPSFVNPFIINSSFYSFFPLSLFPSFHFKMHILPILPSVLPFISPIFHVCFLPFILPPSLPSSHSDFLPHSPIPPPHSSRSSSSSIPLSLSSSLIFYILHLSFTSPFSKLWFLPHYSCFFSSFLAFVSFSLPLPPSCLFLFPRFLLLLLPSRPAPPSSFPSLASHLPLPAFLIALHNYLRTSLL